MFRYLPLIFKNTLRNRRRSMLTLGSIAASFCLLGTMFAMYEALYHSEPTPSQALRLITRHRVSLTQVMPASYKQRIKQVPGVAALYTSMWFGGTYKDDRDQRNFFARFAVEPEDFFKVQTDLKMPEEQKLAFMRERTACIVGTKLAEKFGFKLGDRIVLKGDIFPGNYELTVRGIYDSVDDTETLFFNLDYLYQSLPVARRDFAGTFNILVASKEQTGEVSRTVDEMFKNAPVQTRTETEQAFLLSFVGFLGNVKAIVFAICAAVTFTILLVSANTMAMSVRERVREVGIMKTLGFTQGALLGILLGEAMAISLMGAAL
ncbi:MAG: ABC transporter permease, partial [Acidobacteria bacterium]|nr:ABC transporter permease [Acidobacteriota bacterium]